MALHISPTSVLKSLDKGEDASYKLNFNPQLDGDTIASHTFKIYDSAGADVTANFGGGSAEVPAGYITFGVKAYDLGEYTLEFWVICNETLPDGVTPKELFAEMTVTIV